MKALLITPKNARELKFISDLLNKLGMGSSTMTEDELEDLGLSKLMKNVDRTKKVSRDSIMKKLNS